MQTTFPNMNMQSDFRLRIWRYGNFAKNSSYDCCFLRLMFWNQKLLIKNNELQFTLHVEWNQTQSWCCWFRMQIEPSDFAQFHWSSRRCSKVHDITLLALLQSMISTSKRHTADKKVFSFSSFRKFASLETVDFIHKRLWTISLVSLF